MSHHRAILEYTYSYNRSNRSVSTVPVHDFLLKNNILPIDNNPKSFQNKFSDVEKRYLKLKKSHNARCQREGSHQNGELENHCNKIFLHYKEVLTLPNDANYSTKTVSLLSDELKTPNKPKKVRPSNMTDATVQVSSPQVKTEGQLRRKERSSKKKLFVQDKELLMSNKKLKVEKDRTTNYKIKHKVVHKSLKEQRTKLIVLNNKCKQLSEKVKKQSFEIKELTNLNGQNSTSESFNELLDKNITLEKSLSTLKLDLDLKKSKR